MTWLSEDPTSFRPLLCQSPNLGGKFALGQRFVPRAGDEPGVPISALVSRIDVPGFLDEGRDHDLAVIEVMPLARALPIRVISAADPKT